MEGTAPHLAGQDGPHGVVGIPHSRARLPIARNARMLHDVGAAPAAAHARQLNCQQTGLQPLNCVWQQQRSSGQAAQA